MAKSVRSVGVITVAASALMFFVVNASAGRYGYSTTAATDAGGAIVGGRTAVENVRDDKEVQDLGRFSVEEYNRMRSERTGGGGGNGAGPELRFGEVVEAEKQVVSGIKYYLKINVATDGDDGATPRVYEAVVVVKPWKRQQGKELLGFDPVVEN